METATIRLALGGDAMLGRLFNERLAHRRPEEVWRAARHLWADADLFAVNLETAITDATTPVAKTFNFRLSPCYADVLTAGGIGYVSLANNHVLDYGTVGLEDTLAHLPASIARAGAGRNLAEAKEPALLTRRDVTVGFLSAADHPEEWAASETEPGIFWFSYREPGPLLEALRGLRERVDLLVVSLHWGPNWQPAVDRWRRRLAERLVEAGADVIHGHSPHHVQPIERLGKSYVAYSLGSLIDDYAIDPTFRNDLGAILRLTAGKAPQGILDADIVPVRIKQLSLHPATGSDAEFVHQRMGI